MTRDELKKRYQEYRKVAQRKYSKPEFTIDDFANVEMTEDGAFVTAIIWIPLSDLKEEK